MEYRDRAGREKRKRRRRKREEDRWASLAGPVEVRRLDELDQGEAEDDGPSCTKPTADGGTEGDSRPRDEAGGDTA